MQFSTLLFSLVALATAIGASPTPAVAANNVAVSIISDAELEHWLATTDADLTFIGGRPDLTPLAKRSAQSTTVTYCNKRVGSICGGTCTVYTGGATCLPAPDTACLASTKDVGFCDEAGCNGDCNVLSQCGTTMGSGFCATPGTMSILVSSL
ncbi:hypothetical protein C8Q79DRAFT_913788 [Trametes meyenii]|nr:hypothetical protein C8Q79DRAFT_913788 [Trametes meyenii]